MKSKSIKALIKEVRSQLEWPVLEKHNDAPIIRVASNSQRKSHIILMPDKLHIRSSDMDYLHELGHATLCEKVHPIFSVNIQCVAADKKRQFLPVVPALNAACDWFVGHWQFELNPKQAGKQIRETLKVAEDVLANPQMPPLEIILYAAILIAQSIHYLDEPIDCGGVLKNVVDAFLSVPPDQPTTENCVLLINRLLATYTDQRARLVKDGDAEVWDIYPTEDTCSSPESHSVKQS